MATAASRPFGSFRRLARAVSAHGRLIVSAAGALAALTAVAVVATNGFHFHQTSARKKVSAYIQSVDRVEQQMTFRISKVMAAYKAYASNSRSSASVPQLVRAAGTFDLLRMRIAELPVPSQAARLRTLLVSLLSAEAQVTTEVAQLARFTPRFHIVAVQLQLLSVELSKSLAAVPQPKPHLIRGTKKQVAATQAGFAAAATHAAAAQANVVDAYDAALGVLLGRLARMTPPPVMAPAYAAEVATLNATRASGAKLAAGLRAPKRSNIAALSRRFSIAARTAGSLLRQREEIAAVKAYDARVKRIGHIELAVESEFNRLSNHVH